MPEEGAPMLASPLAPGASRNVSHRVAFEMTAFPRKTRPSASCTPAALRSCPLAFHDDVLHLQGSPSQA